MGGGAAAGPGEKPRSGRQPGDPIEEEHLTLTAVEWGCAHALCQARPKREAFVGRPIWRGKVKLTLESQGPDWEKTPPVTY